MNLSDKSVLVYDNGLFVSLAERLAELKAFKKVGFFLDWQSSFPDGRELVVGTGLDGITRVKYFWDEIDQYDLIVFADVWNGDLQEYLRKQGHRIWGAGRGGNLELSRWQTKETLRRLGLPDNEAVQIRGIDNLRSYLKSHEDVFVKVSALRGLGETFESGNYVQSKGQIDELEAKYGAMLSLVDFIVEKKIPDAKEVGYDGYNIDGEFPNQSFMGIEVKDRAYFGALMDYDKLPESVRETNTKLSYGMDGYRQFWSTELREKGGKGYLIDATARHASPAGECFCHAFTNLPEILYEGAGGVLVHPKSSAKYAAQILLCSEWAEEHWQAIQFPEEIRPWVKLYNHCRVNGVDYVVPQLAKMKQVGSVIGLGNTPDEAANLAKDRAKQIRGFDLEAECDALDEAMAEMKGLEQ